MTYGLKVYDEFGNTRLDVADRQIRFLGTYSGTITYGTPVEILIPGMTNDGTWGINILNTRATTDIRIGEGKVELESTFLNSNYNVQVFRI